MKWQISVFQENKNSVYWALDYEETLWYVEIAHFYRPESKTQHTWSYRDIGRSAEKPTLFYYLQISMQVNT